MSDLVNRVLAYRMVSLLHEGVIKLVRDRLAFAAGLVGDVMKLKVPQFGRTRLVDVTLNELAPVEYWADPVVVFTRKKPVRGDHQVPARSGQGQAVHLACAGERSR